MFLTRMDSSLGCVVGAFIGDSIGSLLEFQNLVTEEEVEKALTMPGGGPFYLVPGQVTDDSELAIALARALCDMKDGVFDVETVATHYISWLKSGPFDKGKTVSNALWGSSDATECYKNAMRTKSSESNGGLMRITPLAVYCSLFDDDVQVESFVRAEQALTHANKTVQDAAVAYVLTIRSLIRNGTSDMSILEKFDSLSEYISAINDRIPGNKNIGHARIAWSYAFYHLQRGSTYLEAMRDVLSQGGDTDTNCAIVGGLIGASLGLQRIQEEIPEQFHTFLECRPRRPYVPSSIIQLVKTIWSTKNNDTY